MKTKTSVLSRCLAMLLALVLSFANVPGLVLTAFAAEKTVYAGSVMAENYDLTDAEKALLNSGYLAGDYAIEYDLPKDSDVKVDAEAKEITAAEKDGWKAVSADIIVNDAVEETVTLNDGVGNYAYAGNAFSVKVSYVLTKDVAGEKQEIMFNAIDDLKNGVANLKAGYSAEANLGTVGLAIDVLNQLADGIKMYGVIKVQFKEEAIAAVKALKKEYDANGVFDLQSMNAEYAEAASKVEYLVENGAAYGECLAETYKNVLAIKNDVLLNNEILDEYLATEEPANYTKWMTLKNILGELVATLESAAGSWDTENLVKEGADYAALDTLVAALGELTHIQVIAVPLEVEVTSVVANMNTKNIAVKVALNVVEDVADSDALVEAASKEAIVIVDEEATAEDIAAKVEASGIEAAAIAEWGEAYAAEHFNREVVAEGTSYTVTYSPKDYEVTGDVVMTVPYGYKLTLPAHEDSTKAYDYKVNGEKKAQGAVVEILGNTEVIRSLGKSYTNETLYNVIANNYGDELAKAILTSGALFGDEAINYRKPDPADAGALLELKDGKLTAVEAYPSSYEGLDWAPYTYGKDGDENVFSANPVDWAEKEVKAQYKLEFTNYTAEEVKEILDLAKSIKEDAAAQKATLDKMAAYHSTMGQLDNVKLAALTSVIDVVVEDAALRDFFKAQVNGITGENLDGKYLRIYNMLGEYNKDGLLYYYRNSEAVLAEISSLSDRLSAMLEDDVKVAAIEDLVSEAGFPEYADKIKDLEGILATVKADLTAPNAAIDTESENLKTLMDALEQPGTVTYKTPASPYVLSAVLTALDESQVNVQVIIEVPGKEITVTGASLDKGAVLDEAYIADLKGKVDAKVAELLGSNVKYYELTVEGGKVEEHLNETIEKQINISYTYTVKEYTVKIDGEADQKININKLYINLPKHPTTGWRYEYTVDGKAETASSYTFTLEQLNRLFITGSYTITREAINEKDESFEQTFGDWFVKDAEGNVIALEARIDANQDGIMGFANKFIDGGYTYVKLGEEDFLYTIEDGSLEISVQAFIDALLNDEGFTSDRIIELGSKGKGDVLNTTIKLGADGEVLPFTLYLNSVPSQMGTVSRGLKAIEDYLTFGAEDGNIVVTADLPEKVYEVYLAAMLATGNVDKTDITALNSAIAYQFLWDYIEIILESDADMVTYTNTLKKLGIDKNLTGYNKYYNMVKDALTHKDMIIAGAEGDDFAITVNAPTKAAIDKLLGVLGFTNNLEINLALGFIKEYKGNGNPVTVKTIARLADAGTDFEAAVADVKAAGITNKFDFVKDGQFASKKLAGEAAIILLDDINGNLTFNHATILDLNGHKVNGNITANGRTLIFDSSLDTFNCGGVTGTVSGKATIVGGNYNANVSAYLPDGYVQDGKAVRNVLYYVEENSGKVVFNADADVINASIGSYTEAAAMIGADMAVDIILNYFTAASLEIVNDETNEIYKIYDFSVKDIIGLYDSADRKEALINTALGFVDVEGIEGFVNYIIDELLEFADIEAAFRNDEPVFELKTIVRPWHVRVAHNTSENYIELGIDANPELKEEVTFGFKLASDNVAEREYAADIFGVLSDISAVADAQFDVTKPSYKNGELSVSGTAFAKYTVDITKDNNTNNDFGFSNEEYLNVFAVVVANGVPAKRAALVEAIKLSGKVNYYDEMKEVIDQITVKELFDALKALSRSDDFADMCTKLGLDANELGKAAELEEIYHLLACAAGKGLETLNITGPNSKLGNIYENGYYRLSGTRSAEESVSASGYTLTVGAENVSVDLAVKLYPDVAPHVHTEATREENRIEATCGKDGSYDLVTYCSVCNEELGRETKVIPATGKHTALPVVEENYVAPTCENTGSVDKVIYCGGCGCELGRETEIIPATGHNFTYGNVEYTWAKEDGIWNCTATRIGTCDCGETDTWRAVAASVTSKTVKPATCCEKGETEYTARFNETWAGQDTLTVEDIEINPDAHEWSDWEIIERPTTSKRGRAKHVCLLCGEEEFKYLPKRPKPSVDEPEEDEENPSTGAPVSAFSAIAVLAGAAIAIEGFKKH